MDHASTLTYLGRGSVPKLSRHYNQICEDVGAVRSADALLSFYKFRSPALRVTVDS